MKRAWSVLVFILHFALSIVQHGHGQAPSIKMWDSRFGGNDFDYLTCFIHTADKGFLMGGLSSSGTSGNKLSPNRGGRDYWIVKTDSLGNKVWDQDFGGIDFENLQVIRQTRDGGYILGGFSASGINGDKSQSNWGIMDYWIIKTDSFGNKIWDKDFGGMNDDELNDVQQTSDGGYILAGFSNSGIGGDKTEPIKGLYDYWVLKLDSLGNKIWDKDFGGNATEVCYSIIETNDYGYLIAGCSQSSISGDKSQNSYGIADYWIIKTDSGGNKLWDKDFGGNDWDELHSTIQLQDDGYLLTGISYSGISGNKISANKGISDYWIIRIDSIGNKLWEKDFGGNDNEDEIGPSSISTGNTILIAGSSYSNIIGDKTENNMGAEQSWMLKTDSMGNIKWDKTIWTPGHHESGYAIETSAGCYVIATIDNINIGGYQSHASLGDYDYWMVKLCDTSAVLPPVATAGLPQSICPGTCTNFENYSINALTYQWTFPGALPDSSTSENPTNICYATPGNYDVQLIATNVNSSDTLLLTNYITVYSYPAAQSIIQSGDSLFAIVGSSYYQWYFNGNIIPGATNYFYLAQSSGDYNVIATDVNGCEVEAVINNVIAAVGPESFREHFVIFPNPVEDKFTIQKLALSLSKGPSGTAVEISIYNVLGEKVYTADYNEPSIVNCEQFPAGLYYIEITSGKKTYRTKFIKQ